MQKGERWPSLPLYAESLNSLTAWSAPRSAIPAAPAARPATTAAVATLAPAAGVFTPLAIAIEVLLGSRFVSLLVPAFERYCAGGIRRGFAATHFCPLFFEDCFARKLN